MQPPLSAMMAIIHHVSFGKYANRREKKHITRFRRLTVHYVRFGRSFRKLFSKHIMLCNGQSELCWRVAWRPLGTFRTICGDAKNRFRAAHATGQRAGGRKSRAANKWVVLYQSAVGFVRLGCYKMNILVVFLWIVKFIWKISLECWEF